jgi:hypothetical protein
MSLRQALEVLGWTILHPLSRKRDIATTISVIFRSAG